MFSCPGIAFSAWPIRSSFTDPTQVHMLSSFEAPSELTEPQPESPVAAAAPAPAPSARNFLLLNAIRLTWRFLCSFPPEVVQNCSGTDKVSAYQLNRSRARPSA